MLKIVAKYITATYLLLYQSILNCDSHVYSIVLVDLLLFNMIVEESIYADSLQLESKKSNFQVYCLIPTTGLAQ